MSACFAQGERRAGDCSGDVGGLPRPVRVVAVRRENDRVMTLTLGVGLQARPGQFVLLWLPGLDEKPFSILAPDPLAVAVAAVGPFSRALQQLGPGDQLWLRGPQGNGFRPVGSDHLLVGGGYGVAPMVFLARVLAARGHRIRAVEGARTAAELLLVEALAQTGAEVILTTEDGSRGLRGRVTDAVGPLLGHDRPSALYACGPEGMLGALSSLATAAGIPAQLSWEAYMRCGMGLCGSCERDGALLCCEGPVVAVEPDGRDGAGGPDSAGRE